MRRFIALFLSVCLVLGALPAAVFADGPEPVPEGLYYRWVEVYAQGAELQEELRTDLNGSPGDSATVQFVYVDGSGQEKIFNWEDGDLDDLSFPGSIGFGRSRDGRGEFVDPTWTDLFYGDFGEFSISYHGFSIAVHLGLPEFGFYSSTERSTETYLSSWEWTDPGDVAYVLFPDNVTVTTLGYDDYRSDWLHADLDASGRFITVSMDIVPFNEDRAFICISGYTRDGEPQDTGEWGLWINTGIRDARVWPEGLYYRPVRWRDGKVEADPLCDLQEGYVQGAPGWSEARQFVYIDGDGNQHVLADEDLLFYGDFFDHCNGNPDFMHDGEVLVDIIFTGTGEDGWVKYVTEDEREFAMKIFSRLPEYGIYSTPEAREDTILSEWDYNGKNDTVYFVSQEPGLLDSVYLPEEDAEWTGLLIGPVVDGTYAALTVTDIDSFQGSGFTLLYDYSLGEDEHYNGNEVWIFIFDERPLIWSWVNDRDGEFFVEENEDRTMWVSPADDLRVQFRYIEEDGSQTPLKLTELTFENCHADYATDWDGNVIDETYVTLTFDDFGEGRIIYDPEGTDRDAELPIHIQLPGFGYYDIERPVIEDEHSESWNDQLRAHFQKEWVFDGTNNVLYIRGTYNASLAWITRVENESDHHVLTDILEDGKLVRVTLVDPVSWQDWLNLKIVTERRDDEGNPIEIEGQTEFDEWANIRIRDARPRLCFYWADEWWDGDLEQDVYEARVWEDYQSGLWQAPGRNSFVRFYTRDSEGNEAPVSVEDLAFDGKDEFYEVEDRGDGYAFISFYDWGFGKISLAGVEYDNYLPVEVSSDLPGFGFYSIEKPTADEEHEPEWNEQLREAYVSEIEFDGTEATYWIRGAYNESLAYITGLEWEDNYDIDWEIAEDEKSIRVTINSIDPERDWLNLTVYSEHRDGEDIYYGEEWASVHVIDKAPRLVACWTDSHWDGEVQDYIISVSDWENPLYSLVGEPGNGWRVSFFYRDGEGDLTPLTGEDLTWNEDLARVNDNGETENLNAHWFMVIMTGFGESDVVYSRDGADYCFHLRSDMSGWEFFDFAGPSVEQFIGDPDDPQPNPEWNEQLMEHYLSRWDYDGTDEAKTIYLRGVYNESMAYIAEVFNHSDHDVTMEISEDHRCVKITMNEPGENDYLDVELKLQRIDEEGNPIVFENGDDFYMEWTDIWVRNIEPDLVWRGAEAWDWIDEENRPELAESEDGYLDRRLYISPDDGWWGQFFIMDSEENLTYARLEDMNYDHEKLEIREVEVDGKIFHNVVSLCFGETDITCGTYTLHVISRLPDVGFYSAPEAIEENYITHWVFRGTNDTIYLMPDDEHVIGDPEDMRICNGAGVTLTKVGNYYEIRLDDPTDTDRVELAFLFGDIYGPDGETNWYDGERWKSIGIDNLQSGLVWRWADAWGWNGALDRPEEFHEHEDDRLERSLTQSPGDEWWIQFFMLDEEGNLTPARKDDLVYDSEKYDITEYEDGGKFYCRVRCLAFGDSAITFGESSIPTQGILPQVGFYKAPVANEENFLCGEWLFDGTEDTQTVYYVPYWGEEGDRWALFDIRWKGGSEISIDFDPSTDKYATLTLNKLTDDYIDIDMIFAQYGRGEQADEIVWESGWRGDGIRIRDMRPRLIAGFWGWSGSMETPASGCLEVWDEGETGRWAGYVHWMNFWLPGDPDTYITEGIVSSDEGIVTLSYNEEYEVWNVDVHGYGDVSLSWTDPEDGETYIIRIHAGEPDGFYDNTNDYLDGFLGYKEIEAEPVDYTIGEGKSLYFRDHQIYDLGIEAVLVVGENPMGVTTAEVEDDTLWTITVPESAEGDFSVTVRITFFLSDEDLAYIAEHAEEYPDGYYEEYTITFHGTHKAVRKLRSDDGMVEAVIDKETGTVTVTGLAGEDELVLVASYDENGRFLGLVAVSKDAPEQQAEADADEVKIFWIDEDTAPKAEDAEVPMN